jgi:acyl carrier protein
MEIKEHEKTSRADILDKLRILLDPWLDNAAGACRLSEQTSMLSDLHLDSVAILQVILGVEKEFNITIRDYELNSDVLRQTSNLIELIYTKIHENN